MDNYDRSVDNAQPFRSDQDHRPQKSPNQCANTGTGLNVTADSRRDRLQAIQPLQVTFIVRHNDLDRAAVSSGHLCLV